MMLDDHAARLGAESQCLGELSEFLKRTENTATVELMARMLRKFNRSYREDHNIMLHEVALEVAAEAAADAWGATERIRMPKERRKAAKEIGRTIYFLIGRLSREAGGSTGKLTYVDGLLDAVLDADLFFCKTDPQADAADWTTVFRNAIEQFLNKPHIDQPASKDLRVVAYGD